MDSGITFHWLAALLYAAMGVAVWWPMTRSVQANAATGDHGPKHKPCLSGRGHARQFSSGAEGSPESWRKSPEHKVAVLHTNPWWVLIAIVLHGVGLHQLMLSGTGLVLGWALALSAAIWLGLVVFWLENLIVGIDSLLLVLLPTATIGSILAGIFPRGVVVVHAGDDWLRMHLTIALVGYGLMIVAAVQAMMMTALERQLHRPVQGASERSWWSRALDAMPPLLMQERLLFRLILVGFIALTLTVASGAIVSLRLHGSAFPLDHKTIFTLSSWITFGVLLAGRRLYGWRGRIALRWALTGFAFLLLAYTGTRFVLEVLLGARG